MNPIRKIVLDALDASKDDLLESLRRLGRERLRMYLERTPEPDRNALDLPTERIGEHAIEHARTRTAEPDAPVEAHVIEAMLDASWDEGYRQACEDIATQFEAYEKGLN